MTREITYNDLWSIKQDMMRIMNGSPALVLLLGEKMDKFFQKNSLELSILDNKLQSMQDRYIQRDREGKLMREELEPGKFEWVFKNSITDNSGLPIIGVNIKELYYQEANEFLNRSIDIIL